MTNNSFTQIEERVAGFIATASDSDADSDLEFQQLALDLFALQFEHVPPFHGLCEAQNILPGIIKDWRDIPAVPTAAFKEFEISSLPSAERTRVFHSSGTISQKPSRHFHGADSLRIYEASLLTWFRRNFPADSVAESNRDLSRSGARLQFAFLTPPASAAPHSSLVYMFDTIAREGGGRDAFFAGQLQNEVWILRLDDLVGGLRNATESGRPVAILGTAFLFVHLLDHCAANKIVLRLAPGSWILETGGYKGRSREVPKPELYRLMTKHLGIPATHIVSEYGMSELSSQAYDGRIKNSKLEIKNAGALDRVCRFPPWARARIISPETGREVNEGETGLIRVMDLANVRSVLAIQTEDLGIRRGNGFELIGRAALSEPRGCSLLTQ